MTIKDRSFSPYLLTAIFLFLGAGVVFAQRPPCQPCAGLTVQDPGALVEVLRQLPPLRDEARLYVRWIHEDGSGPSLAAASQLQAVGAVPWLSLTFETPPPLLENLEALEVELAAAVAIAKSQPTLQHFDILWSPIGSSGEALSPLEPEEYAYLLKRASVSLQGATPEARVLPRPLLPTADTVASFYAHGGPSYLDGLVFAAEPGSGDLLEAAAAVAEVDPGRTLVALGLPAPQPTERTLVEAARLASSGFAVTLFDLPQPTAADLAPLVVLANEFQGDLSYDRASSPTGEGVEAWAFVRGEDLQTRVIAGIQSDQEAPRLWFADPTLRGPERFDLETGEPESLFGQTREAQRFGVQLDTGDAVAVLSLDRPTAEELAGVAEQVDVSGEKVVPVEEILRRLQAFEDAQDRRLRHYQAVHTNHLRFEGGGSESIDVTYEGAYFYQRGVGFDWAWQRLFINGVRWKREELPELPILQAERAASAPLEIHFTPEFRYQLRGTEEIDGRPTWVVDFEPGSEELGTERKLHRGTVWVDQQHFGRVKMRTLQLGLTGDVISNDETVFFRPLDDSGEPADWTPDSYWLPTESRGQQIFTIVNQTLVVEREGRFSSIQINRDDFEAQHQAILESKSTMVRDTDKGLRYLTKSKETGQREVQEEFDTSRLFLVGGVFYDDAADFPIPLAGVNYLDLDFRDKGQQLNVFFAGVLLTADLAEPSLFGSRWDAGIGAFGLAIPLTDEAYRSGEEAPEEDVEFSPASLEFNLGRPIGNFFRLGLEYEITSLNYSTADDTAEDFTVPSDHLIHSFELQGRYSRNGYRLTLEGSYNLRSEWDAWGTPDEVASFDPNTDEFLRYKLQLAKNWYLPRFQRIGAEIVWAAGEDLDRFNKYEFGSFSDTRVHGYQSSFVRAEEVVLGHLSYGLNAGDVVRIEGLVDVAWATDEESGLENELLAGLGLSGGFLGPWGTLMRIDAGVAVAGPDDGFGIELLFLKLFR